MKRIDVSANDPSVLKAITLVAVVTLLMLSNCSPTSNIPPTPSPTSTPTPESAESEPPVLVEPTKEEVITATVEITPEPTEELDEEDVCSLITVDDAETVLGQAVTAITPGAEPDDVTGGTLNYCTYRGSDMAVVITVVGIDSAAVGTDQLHSKLSQMKEEDPETKTQEALGVGDQAYWTVSENAAGYIVLTQSSVFSVVLGGNIGSADSHKNELLTLAQIIASNQ